MTWDFSRELWKAQKKQDAFSQIMCFPSYYDSKHVLKQPCMAYSGDDIMTYSGSLHGSTYLAVGALVDGLHSHTAGGRLIRMICNNYCVHNYEEWHWIFLYCSCRIELSDILWSVHFESYVSCYNNCNINIPTLIFKKLLSCGIVWHLHNYHWNLWQIQTVKSVYIAVEKYLLIRTNVIFASVTENAYFFSLLMRKIVHLVKEILSEAELAFPTSH